MEILKYLRNIGFLFLIVCIFSLFIPIAVAAQQLDSTEVELMKSRIRELVLTDFPDADSVHQLLSKMNSDGSWQGIDYNSIEVEPWPRWRTFLI